MYPGICVLVMLAGYILGSMPSNSLLGWLTLIGAILLAVSVVSLLIAWLIYGIIRLFRG